MIERILFALRCKCPACGVGPVFTGYLKQSNTCSACQISLGHIRVDDGPIWLTLIVACHIVGGLMLRYIPETNWAPWVDFTLWPLLSIALVLGLLPLSKSIFISILWAQNPNPPRE